ncbi:unnamed protein product [Hydatigera taeniaeformis]|uniref:Uncharacterized protein n=1 Tax=Hydatigena taeniaeformis TaxID=6205 RepID=A0A0R3XA84_HYDTA|nr:unnamed protein product [Hydatigera taeniaeformis]
MSIKEIEQCLTLLKQTISCPIWALTSAEKFEQIALLGKKIIDDFVEESRREFVPVTKFEQLHLSQELSQAQVGSLPLTVKNVQPKVVSTRNKSSETVVASSLRSGFSLLTKRYSRCDQPRTCKRTAVALGASARILKHRMPSKELVPVPDIDEPTQPMRAQGSDEALPDGLFAMTQTPLVIEPATLTLDELPDPSNKDNQAQVVDTEGNSMRRSRVDGDLSSCCQRGSKLSLVSSLKRSSFLRSISRSNKRRNQSQSPEPEASPVSSDIPSLRERLSTSSAATLRRKKRRKTNELYSPWLHNSRLHFLKKYRIPPAFSKARTSDPSTSPNVFSPGWSRLKSLSAEFGRQSKTQLLIRSTKKRSSSKRDFKSVEVTSRQPNLGPVCRFILPSRGPLFEVSQKEKVDALLCSRCGCEIIFFSKPAAVLTSSKPCPIVRDLGVYWPESWRQSPQMIRQTNISTALDSAVNIISSSVPQTPCNSHQSCAPAKSNEISHIQISMSSEKGTPSTINIQPSLVPQSFSLNTQSSEGNYEEQVCRKKLDRRPSVFEYVIKYHQFLNLFTSLEIRKPTQIDKTYFL